MTNDAMKPLIMASVTLRCTVEKMFIACTPQLITKFLKEEFYIEIRFIKYFLYTFWILYLVFFKASTF